MLKHHDGCGVTGAVKSYYGILSMADGWRRARARVAIETLGEAERLKITGGKAPMGIAAAALYLACVMNGKTRTQKMLAEAAGVTEVTIRNRYTELKRFLDLDMLKPERG